jgi:hypothetical protein
MDIRHEFEPDSSIHDQKNETPLASFKIMEYGEVTETIPLPL